MFLYLLIALPPMLFALWAQSRVKSAFNKYSKIRTRSGYTGAEVARRLLESHGLYDVTVERVNGFLSDHYDPRAKALRLSPDVYDGRSLASAGVAAHEAGHALQHKQGYAMLQIRSSLVPAVQFGSSLGPILFTIGFFLSFAVRPLGFGVALIGVLFFAASVVFALVTLPVEFDASARAKQQLTTQGLLFGDELDGVSSMLNAAALTYVAAAVQAIASLLYYVFILVGMSRD